jgi:WD40 repeat protein
MRPLIQTPQGVGFQSREAILYKDGTAKLWSTSQKDPVAPVIRHDDPIRELTFFDEAGLLMTRSDASLKAWDGLTGVLRKEFSGQTITPLWIEFAPVEKRFVTVDRDGRIFTLWDAETLAPVATVNATATARSTAAGLSRDGKTLVRFTFGTDPALELWDIASGRPFAILRSPSAAVTAAYNEHGQKLNEKYLERNGRFWQLVDSLAPKAARHAP